MVEKSTLSSQWKLFICIIICQSVGIISGLIAATNNNSWFASLQKPSWNPPGYLFGPVWTILYLLMSISLWIVWKSNTDEKLKEQAALIFAMQLFLNFWWSVLFFKFQSPLFAFIDIVFMTILILISILQFSKFSKLAAWLLVPYISWVCFAALLNYKIMILNN